MDRKNLLITGSLVGIILIFGFFIITNPLISDVPYSIDADASYCGDETYFYFDNSTPEATAISIARLNEGMQGFGSNIMYNCGFASYTKVNASLTSDGKYWIVKMSMGGSVDWLVTVDAKTLMSKKSRENIEGASLKEGFERESLEGTVNTWRSLDELKASYIAELKTIPYRNLSIGNPDKVILDGKSIWKVPVYKWVLNSKSQEELAGYVYVDLETGKSKGFLTGMERWSILKEVDDALTKVGSSSSPPFKDALRDLYPD